MNVFRIVSLIFLLFLSVDNGWALEVTLAWLPNTEPELAGYKVYYAADSPATPMIGKNAVQGDAPIDVGNNTSAVISGLDSNRTYFFAVTAYNSSGIESSFSNIVSVPNAYPNGDLDGDGSITAIDAQIAQKIAIGKLPVSQIYITRGDVAPLINGTSSPNGTIDTGDVIVILNKAINLIP